MIDPIRRLKDALIDVDLITVGQIEEKSKQIDKVIAKAWEKALKDKEPDPKELLLNVYSEM